MFKKIALLAALVGLVGNTVAVAATPAPTTGPEHIEVVLYPTELAVDVPNTGGAVAAGVGGIFGALIGAAINKAAVSNAEGRVAEMRNALVDYDFNARVEQAIRAKLAAAPLVTQPTTVEYLHTVRGADELKAANAANRTGILFVVPRYAVTSDFERLTVTLSANTFDRSVRSNGTVKEKIRGFKLHSYAFPMRKVTGSGATEDSQRWVTLGGTELAAMLDEGIDQVTDMLVNDLTAEGMADAAAKTPMKGRSVTTASGRTWTRTRAGLSSQPEIDGVTRVYSERAAARAAALVPAPVASDVNTAAPADGVAPAAAAPVEASAAPAAAAAVEAAVPAEVAAPAEATAPADTAVPAAGTP
jgi:hypothetical protein